MTPEQKVNFKRLLNPRHIAFVGGQDALIALGEARRIGYQGEIWPVNPRRQLAEGITCYKSVDELPVAPDAVFLAVPVPQAIEIVQQLSAQGAGGVVCYTAGFGELGDQGKKTQETLIQAAGDIALVGPNCYGFINYLERVALWPFAHGGDSPGYGSAIITQSGMLSSDLTMNQRSLPLTHMISIGNQAMLAIEDVIEVLCEDERVRAIGLHIEGLKSTARFAQAAAKAATLGKPIVAFKTGSSTIGKALTSSHTGSLSGEDDLYDALFERTGVIRVYSPAQLLETLKFFSVAGAIKGNNMFGLTCSGGGATMLADYAEPLDLNFPAFTAEINEQLSGLLPAIATVTNPLDYTTPIWGQEELTRPVFSKAISAGVDAAILVQDYPAKGFDDFKDHYLADGNAFADAALEHNVPAAICSTLPENMDEETRAHFISRGIAPMQGINEALEAIAASVRWHKMRNRIIDRAPQELLFTPRTEKTKSSDEAEAKSVLQSFGVAVPYGMVCTATTALQAATEIGFPVALKMVHSDLTHKTEVGAVSLGLRSVQELRDAITLMRSNVSALQPDALSNRFLVERLQPTPIAELIVSIRRDDQFGLAMTLGSGGILVELISDAKTILLPTDHAEIIRALKSLKAARLMAGFRGKPRIDLHHLAASILSMCEHMQQCKETVVEFEINPLFVYEHDVCAVDALLYRDAFSLEAQPISLH